MSRQSDANDGCFRALRHGGMCYVGLRKYADAAELFLHAITAPASAMSAVVVAAFKKYTLASLIASRACHFALETGVLYIGISSS